MLKKIEFIKKIFIFLSLFLQTFLNLNINKFTVSCNNYSVINANLTYDMQITLPYLYLFADFLLK